MVVRMVAKPSSISSMPSLMFTYTPVTTPTPEQVTCGTVAAPVAVADPPPTPATPEPAAVGAVVVGAPLPPWEALADPAVLGTVVLGAPLPLPAEVGAEMEGVPIPW
jgi:hypothetical protein